MITIVGVRFRDSGKAYYFDPGEFEIRSGMNVVVETARGIEFGTAAGDIRQVHEEAVTAPLKKVLRIATLEDVEKAQQNRIKEREAIVICKEKIRKHELEMKLIDAEYSFDGTKILFYFTADGRIDFRGLVKDLASVFRTRIELRQIGVRDETKILGGIGICGRPLCCSTWLTDFVPVSIRMAKEQNLSLNPTKISGTCGRLMCCLKNEQATYEYLNSQLPSVGEHVKALTGEEGVVSNVSVLRQKVRVLIDMGEEKEMKEFDVSELEFAPKQRKQRDGENKERRGDSCETEGKDSKGDSREAEGKERRGDSRKAESKERKGDSRETEGKEPGGELPEAESEVIGEKISEAESGVSVEEIRETESGAPGEEISEAESGAFREEIREAESRPLQEESPQTEGTGYDWDFQEPEDSLEEIDKETAEKEETEKEKKGAGKSGRKNNGRDRSGNGKSGKDNTEKDRSGNGKTGKDSMEKDRSGNGKSGKGNTDRDRARKGRPGKEMADSSGREKAGNGKSGKGKTDRTGNERTESGKTRDGRENNPGGSGEKEGSGSSGKRQKKRRRFGSFRNKNSAQGSAGTGQS